MTTSSSALAGSTSDENEWHVDGDFSQEEFTYHTINGENDELEKVVLRLTVAVSARGGSIVSEDHDETGIMLWPASHLMVQTILSGSLWKAGDAILEMGCGCGILGVAAMHQSYRQSSCQRSFYVSTDMSDRALAICRQNLLRQEEQWKHQDLPGRSPLLSLVRQLRWGDSLHIEQILDELRCHSKKDLFDVVIGADILYPDTCGSVLRFLLQTVDRCLREGGTFYLSFVTRDGPRTPMRLIEAASEGGFAISSSEQLDPRLVEKSSPLLGSQVLKLVRQADAERHNSSLGHDDCSVFPGMKSSWTRVLQAQQEAPEVWDMPFESSDF